MFIKFGEIDNDPILLCVDFLNKLSIYNIEKDEIIFQYQIQVNEKENRNLHHKMKSFSVISMNSTSSHSDEISSKMIFFKQDGTILEISLIKTNSLDMISCESKIYPIKFKSNEFEAERILIRKVIPIDEFVILSSVNKGSLSSEDYLVSISYEKYLSIVNLKDKSEISFICFNHLIISHNMNLFKSIRIFNLDETYISVLDCENNFILFSLLPELKICFNIKIHLPVEYSTIYIETLLSITSS